MRFAIVGISLVLFILGSQPLAANTISILEDFDNTTSVVPVSFNSNANPACCNSGGCQPCCDGAVSCCPQVSCNNCCNENLLFGFVAPSDHCFDGFLSPMTNPLYFEDPRTLTEARALFLRHKLPLAAGSGDVNVFAVQLRAALNDRLSVIATKDGYATSTNPLIDDGWADLSAGLKYNLFKDPCAQKILSAGLVFELPVGSQRTLQGNGDGLFNLFVTGGARIGCWNWISGTGFLLPTDTSAESQIWFWSNHIDRRIGCSNFHVLAEINLYHYLKAGDGGIPGLEGGDLINLGSTGVAGNDIVTGAFGLKYKPSNRTEIGIAWENPLTDRRDVLENRLNVDWIFRY